MKTFGTERRSSTHWRNGSAKLRRAARTGERRRLWTDTNGLRRAERPPALPRTVRHLAGGRRRPRSCRATPSHARSSSVCGRRCTSTTSATTTSWSPGSTSRRSPTWGRTGGGAVGDRSRKGPERGRSVALRRPPDRGDSTTWSLSAPRLHYDAAATEERRVRAEDLVGGILPARVTLGNAWRQWASCTPGPRRLRLQNLYVLMVEQPVFVHELMRFMRDGILHLMDEVERAGHPPVSTTPAGCRATTFRRRGWRSGRLRFRDLWGRGESQEIDGVSPGMFEEFLFQYQLPILSRFGITELRMLREPDGQDRHRARPPQPPGVDLLGVDVGGGGGPAGRRPVRDRVAGKGHRRDRRGGRASCGSPSKRACAC